jgi:hypothetical protein
MCGWLWPSFPRPSSAGRRPELPEHRHGALVPPFEVTQSQAFPDQLNRHGARVPVFGVTQNRACPDQLVGETGRPAGLRPVTATDQDRGRRPTPP